MIKLLDGLKAMPITMRIQAIRAMDLADDGWTIEDSILDGQRKKKALEKEKKKIRTQLEQRIQNVELQKDQQDQYLSQVSAEIKQQITDLELLLSEETQQVASRKSTLDTQEKADQMAHKKIDDTLQKHLDSINEVLKSLQKQ
jgi:hydrogenase maturation factor HypE